MDKTGTITGMTKNNVYIVETEDGKTYNFKRNELVEDRGDTTSDDFTEAEVREIAEHEIQGLDIDKVPPREIIQLVLDNFLITSDTWTYDTIRPVVMKIICKEAAKQKRKSPKRISPRRISPSKETAVAALLGLSGGMGGGIGELQPVKRSPRRSKKRSPAKRTSPKRVSSGCGPDEEISTRTGRCIKKCPEGYYRNTTDKSNRCKKRKSKKAVKVSPKHPKIPTPTLITVSRISPPKRKTPENDEDLLLEGGGDEEKGGEDVTIDEALKEMAEAPKEDTLAIGGDEEIEEDDLLLG